jgi:PD-(D/E)XK nuclease superfamily
VTYSYTQISHYIACPRRYRYRYLDGWQEAEVRASTVFGRVFEQAIAALFVGEDAQVVFADLWSKNEHESLNSASATAGTKCFNKHCICSSCLLCRMEVRILDPEADQQLRIIAFWRGIRQ